MVAAVAVGFVLVILFILGMAKAASNADDAMEGADFESTVRVRSIEYPEAVLTLEDRAMSDRFHHRLPVGVFHSWPSERCPCNTGQRIDLKVDPPSIPGVIDETDDGTRIVRGIGDF